MNIWTVLYLCSFLIDFDADDPLGDLLSDEDEEDDNFISKKKKSVIYKNTVSENNQPSSDTSEPQKKQNKAKVIAELFGLEEEEKKEPLQSQGNQSSTASWLGLKDSQAAGSKLSKEVKPVVASREQGNE